MVAALNVKELGSVETWKAVVAETVGVLVFVLIGTGIITASGALEPIAHPDALLGIDSARLVVVSLGVGLTYMAMVALTAGISGGHINPAVTFAAVITGRMGIAKGGAYVVAQIGGAISGAFILKALLADGIEGNLGAVAVNDITMANLGAAFAVELILGFVLVLAMLAFILGPGKSASPLAPVGVGLIFVVGTMLAFALTGAAMNPARALASAWAAGLWGDHWIYWLGPLGGAAIAAVVYEGVLVGRLFTWKK